jgi:UDP-N-acetyl-2-amino-2-deoxyglucuronate dehydrogenase
MTNQQPITAAVIGCGAISAEHFTAIAGNPNVVLTAVSDTDPGRLAAASTAYTCQGYSDYQTMLVAQRPDVVHICTPHHLHAEMAIRCLEQNINVLLEKPLATTLADAAAIIEAADRSSAFVGVCFQNRYNAMSQRLREIIDSHRFGTVHSALASVIWSRDAKYYQRREWRGRWATAGGGVLINQAIHTLDLLQWYLGDVHDVRGTASTLLLPEPIEVEDTASIVLTHADDQRSIFFATNTHTGNEPITIELLAGEATLRLHTDLTVIHPDGTEELVVEQQRRSGEKAYWGASHGLLIDDFYRHVSTGRRFWIDAREALKTLSIITSVYDQSQLRNRIPVGAARW